MCPEKWGFPGCHGATRKTLDGLFHGKSYILGCRNIIPYIIPYIMDGFIRENPSINGSYPLVMTNSSP